MLKELNLFSWGVTAETFNINFKVSDYIEIDLRCNWGKRFDNYPQSPHTWNYVHCVFKSIWKCKLELYEFCVRLLISFIIKLIIDILNERRLSILDICHKRQQLSHMYSKSLFWYLNGYISTYLTLIGKKDKIPPSLWTAWIKATGSAQPLRKQIRSHCLWVKKAKVTL